jgi:hypothetical protein
MNHTTNSSTNNQNRTTFNKQATTLKIKRVGRPHTIPTSGGGDAGTLRAGGASAAANRVRHNDDLVDFKWGSGGDSATRCNVGESTSVQRHRRDLARRGRRRGWGGGSNNGGSVWERNMFAVVFPKAPNLPCAMPLYPAC